MKQAILQALCGVQKLLAVGKSPNPEKKGKKVEEGIVAIAGQVCYNHHKKKFF